ncbi:hypothetical protein H6503_03350 [Candidatus Woesearchaeota archaeon]|nr:hypothetical protein [Candidatus Woesearchaeota archaeon]
MIKIIFAIMILSLALLVGCQQNVIEDGDDSEEDLWPKIRPGKSYHEMELGPYIKDLRE